MLVEYPSILIPNFTKRTKVVNTYDFRRIQILDPTQITLLQAFQQLFTAFIQKCQNLHQSYYNEQINPPNLLSLHTTSHLPCPATFTYSSHARKVLSHSTQGSILDQAFVTRRIPTAPRRLLFARKFLRRITPTNGRTPTSHHLLPSSVGKIPQPQSNSLTNYTASQQALCRRFGIAR